MDCKYQIGSKAEADNSVQLPLSLFCNLTWRIGYAEVMDMGYRIEYDDLAGKYEIRQKPYTASPSVSPRRKASVISEKA